MGKICRNIIGAIGLIVLSQTASAAADGTSRLAQADKPAVPAAAPPPDSSASQIQVPETSAAPSSAVSTAEVTRGERTVPGCALKYMAAELAGKLRGRKWKEFRQEECGATTVLVVFPAAVAPKYSTETPDKARMLTCADQFKANKASDGNGGMKWIEKSGGYYSECVVHLKG